MAPAPPTLTSPTITSPTITLPSVDTRPVTSNHDGDHERFAHYVRARGRDAEAVVLEARVMGIEVEALCGKRWVPSRDPQRFPVCPECKERAKGLRGAT